MLIIDRIVVKAEEEFYNRLADAVQTAFYEGRYLSSTRIKTNKKFSYSNNFELDGITFLEPNVHLCFNNPIVLAPYAKVWKHYRY
jgi:excinuclease ABC subunit A